MKKIVLSFILLSLMSVPPVVQSYAQEQTPSSETPALQAETAAEGEGEKVVLRMEAPLLSDLFSNTPAAVVNEDVITLGDLRERMDSVSEEMQETEPGKQDYLDLLDRMVNSKLIALEAQNMGLDELPEVTYLVDNFAEKLMRLLLMKRHLDSIGIKAEEDEVEELYRERVREIGVSSVLFEKKEDAEQAWEEMEESDFYEVSSKYVEEGKAVGGGESKYMVAKGLAPQILEAEKEMKEGSISPVVKVGKQYVIFLMEDIRFPEDPEAREKARKDIIERKENEAVREYRNSLQKKYAKVKKSRVERLDLEAEEPGLDKLLENDKVLVKMKGEEPIRVKDLVRTLKNKLYHGAEKAAGSKRLNMRKFPTLYEMIQERVEIKEALRVGIDKTEEYRKRVKQYKEALLFESFIKKVIVPEINLKEEELKAYYDENIEEYTSEKMVRLKGLAFHNVDEAQVVIDKLSRGTDFKWLSANAEGQVDKDAEDLYIFESHFEPISALPEGMQETVSGAEKGELKLYESPKGYFYVISVEDVRPPKSEPYEKVEGSIANIVVGKKIAEAMREWTESLREAYEVDLFVTELRNNP